VNEVKRGFAEKRKEYPPIVIVTPFDTTGVVWTVSGPSWPVLHHLKKLCKVALELYEDGVGSDRFSRQVSYMKLTAFFKILNPITERETKTKQDREEPRS
jgi:hypothetical protein